MDDPNVVNKLLDERLRTIQIIVAALLAGVLVFTVFVLFSKPTIQRTAPAAPADRPAAVTAPTPALSLVAIVVFAAALMIWLIVPSRLADREVAKIASGTWTPPAQSQTMPASLTTDTGKLLVVFTTRTIIAAALLEGPAFLGSAAYMIERRAFTLAIVACAVALIVITFPTRGRVLQWLERQQAFIDETRQFGGPSTP